MKVKRLLTLAVVGIAVAAATLVAVSHVGRLAAGTAYAEPALNVSFFNGGGGSAHWLPQKSGIELSVPATGDYAGITLHHFDATAPTVAPTFDTDNYAAGSPRWVMQFAGGGYLFGYPAEFNNQWEVVGCGLPFGYSDYGTALGALQAAGSCGGDVTAVYIVADGSGGTPETDTISDIQYNHVEYIR